MYSTVFIAGYGNSEPEHWQRLWFKDMDSAYFVEQDDWDNPDKDKWIERIEETLLHVEKPILFVAHSIGCQTVVEWMSKYYKNQNIIGALFVAPPDTNREDFPKEIKGFETLSEDKLPFKSIFVISDDDPYSTPQRAEELANLWGSKTLHVGKKGHINLGSNLGEWEEGKEILKSFFK